ncbi:MAG: hypothetical protein RLZ12_654 [Bacillota bacterium]
MQRNDHRFPLLILVLFWHTSALHFDNVFEMGSHLEEKYY